MITRRLLVKTSLLGAAGTALPRYGVPRELHIDRTQDREASPLALVAVGPRASKVDSSWLNLCGETRVPGQWPVRGADALWLKECPFMRLVLADKLEEGLVRSLEVIRAGEPDSLLVAVTDERFSICGRAAQRLHAPVLRLFGGTFEDAIRAWFNPLAVPGLTGFYPEDVRALASRPAVGFTMNVDDRESVELAQWCVSSADAWLLHLTTGDLAAVSPLVRQLQEATVWTDADMLFSVAASEADGVRGSLAALVRLDRQA